jgi:hypothetical protein
MLMNYIDQMADAPNDVVKGALKDKRDERSTVIESLQERVDTLKAEEDKAKASEEELFEAISEVQALTEAREAIDIIDETDDFTAKRRLVELLNITATLRFTEDGEYWVDIHWMRKKHPRKVCVQKRGAGRTATRCIPRA